MIYHGLGIASDYIGTANRLSGCVADCNNWAATFAQAIPSYLKLTGRNATKARVVEHLRAIAKTCPQGSEHYFFVTFSGHGTFRQGSSDPNEVDGRDEAICCDDFLQGGLLWDNEIAAILAGSQGTIVTDCCHSGTMMRVVVDSPIEAVPRFIPFDAICEGLLPCEVHKLCEGANANRSEARNIRDASGAIPGVIHLAGCLDNEYSYDTAQGGAMTLAALAVRRGMQAGATHRYWIESIQRRLPTKQFPQHPVMVATDADIERPVPGKEPPVAAAEQPIASTGETFEGRTSGGRVIRGVIE